MADHLKNPEVGAEVGSILAIHKHLLTGASQFGVTRHGNHLRFEAKYDAHPDLAKIKASFLQEWNMPFTHDEKTGWVYVDRETTPEAIEIVQSQKLPYLHLTDIESK